MKKDAEKHINHINLIKVDGGKLPDCSELGPLEVEDFFIGCSSVTLHEWERVINWSRSNGYDINYSGENRPNNFPIAEATWRESVKWCNALSELEGLVPVYTVENTILRFGETNPHINHSANGYRLPFEKEWEFAARGGTKSNNYEFSGSNDIDAVAWYNLNSDLRVHEVAQKNPNELGIYDMSGNVWEWCYDNSFNNVFRVIRGGAWHSDKTKCRVSYRGHLTGVPEFIFNGFRVVRGFID